MNDCITSYKLQAPSKATLKQARMLLSYRLQEQVTMHMHTLTHTRTWQDTQQAPLTSGSPLCALWFVCALLQTVLQEMEQRKREAEEAFAATQREFDEGLRAEFKVPKEVLGLVIGRNGANVERVQRDTGVARIAVDKRVRVCLRRWWALVGFGSTSRAQLNTQTLTFALLCSSRALAGLLVADGHCSHPRPHCRRCAGRA